MVVVVVVVVARRPFALCSINTIGKARRPRTTRKGTPPEGTTHGPPEAGKFWAAKRTN